MFTEAEAAALLGLSKATLSRMRLNPAKHSVGPHHLEVAYRRYGYRRRDIEAWLASREVAE